MNIVNKSPHKRIFRSDHAVATFGNLSLNDTFGQDDINTQSQNNNPNTIPIQIQQVGLHFSVWLGFLGLGVKGEFH